MSLSESAYQIDKNMEKRLKFWLNMDAWGIDDAVQILIGIDPEKTVKPHTHTNYGRLPGSISLFNGCQIPEPPPEKEYRLVGGELFDSLELVEDNFDASFDDAEYERREEERNELEAYFKKCADIARLFNNPLTLPISPKEWIERALSKNTEIPWLKCATDRNLLPEGLKRKTLAVDNDGLIRLVDKPTAKSNVETPMEYRLRIRARVKAEKAKGTRAFNKVVAEEEGISITRIKQLINDDADSAEECPNHWAGLEIKARQTVSK